MMYKLFKVSLQAGWLLALELGVLAWRFTAALVHGLRWWRASNASRRAEREGVRCSAGHRLVDYGTWRCSCGFCWTGSGWWCPSPSCPRPAAPWLPCSHPGCPLSVPNPHRIP